MHPRKRDEREREPPLIEVLPGHVHQLIKVDPWPIVHRLVRPITGSSFMKLNLRDLR